MHFSEAIVYFQSAARAQTLVKTKRRGQYEATDITCHSFYFIICFILHFSSIMVGYIKYWLILYPISCGLVLLSWCFNINKYCNIVNLSDRTQSWTQLKVWQTFSLHQIIGMIVCCLSNYHEWEVTSYFPWASYQVRKIASCACTGDVGDVFLVPSRLSDTACIMARMWCTCPDKCRDY